MEQVRERRRIEDDWPLVGREDILARIVDAARRPGLSGVVLIGAPGGGRTRLAREACARLALDGCRIAWATATRAAASVAFGALPHLIPPALERSGGALDVLQQFIERFGARTDRPVLAVDDAHLLDSASVALIHHLAVQRRGFLVLTLLSGATVPDALRALWKEWLVLRVQLPALSTGHVDTLLERAFDAPLDAISRARLRDLCAGNPLVLRELVDAGLETGTLRPVDGFLHWTRGGRYVTDRLADVVESQCGLTDPGLRETLEVLACSCPLDHTLVERLVDDAALVEAERRQLVAFDLSGSRLAARLTVPMYGEVIRARMPSSRRRAIYRRLADALAASSLRRADDVLHLAHWRLEAGLPLRCPDLLAAAKQAAARLDVALAGQLATAAGQHSCCARADLVLADGLAADGRYAEAAAALHRAVAGWDPRNRAGRAIADARLWLWAPADPAGPDQKPPDPYGDRPTVPMPGRDAIVDAALAWPRLLEGHVVSTMDAVRTLRLGALPSSTAVWASTAAIVAAGILGRADQVEQLGAEGVAVATSRARGLPYGLVPVNAGRCVAATLSGSLVAAAGLADDGYRAALDARVEQLIAVWAALRGVVARAQGRIEPALDALREAAVLLEGADALRLGRVWLAELAGAYGMTGNAAEAKRWWARTEQYPPAPGVLFDAWIERNRAWVAAADLDLRRAAGHAIRAAGLARATGQPTVEALALFDAARLGAAVETRDRLTELARECPAVKVGVFAAVAGALAANDAHRLDAAADALRGLGYLLPAAEVATAAYRVHARAGHRSSGYAALALAREMLRDCGEVRTPLLDLTGLHTDLTTRELQVARLAADGLSAGAIADRLGLSRRTVNNHLGHVYSKLGLAGRRDLAELLGVPAVPAGVG